MGRFRTVGYFRILVDNFALPKRAGDIHHVAKAVLLDAFGKTKNKAKARLRESSTVRNRPYKVEILYSC